MEQCLFGNTTIINIGFTRIPSPERSPERPPHRNGDGDTRCRPGGGGQAYCVRCRRGRRGSYRGGGSRTHGAGSVSGGGDESSNVTPERTWLPAGGDDQAGESVRG